MLLVSHVVSASSLPISMLSYTLAKYLLGNYKQNFEQAFPLASVVLCAPSSPVFILTYPTLPVSISSVFVSVSTSSVCSFPFLPHCPSIILTDTLSTQFILKPVPLLQDSKENAGLCILHCSSMSRPDTRIRNNSSCDLFFKNCHKAPYLKLLFSLFLHVLFYHWPGSFDMRPSILHKHLVNQHRQESGGRRGPAENI